MSAQEAVDFNAQPDPLVLLMNNVSLDSIQMNDLQAQSSSVVGLWAQGSTDNIKAGDAELSYCASHMETANDNGKSQSGYNSLQTMISNTNNNYGNVMSGGNSILTSTSQAAAQQLSFVQAVLDTMQGFSSIITSWAKGA